MSRVYFLQAGDGGPIKIGITNGTIARRIANLQIGSVEAIKALGSYAGGRDAEAALHKRFGAARIRGEWFTPTSELLDLIAQFAEPEAATRSGGRFKHDHPICKWRKENCVTLKELARLSGVTNVDLSRYESGKRKITPSALPKISKATGIPAKELRPDLYELIFGAGQ